MASKLSHCAYDTHYHIVFPVKYRKTLLAPQIAGAITDIAKEISLRYEIDFENIGCDGNHIHILCSFPPTKYKGGDVVRIFKSITARELFRQFPELRKNLWGGELWSDGYYLATVGERGNWNIVKRYVQNQGKIMKEATQLTLWC
jgi:putative transposase